MRKAQINKNEDERRLEIMLAALRDYAEAARRLSSASYMRTLEAALAMTLDGVTKLPGFAIVPITDCGKDALRDYLNDLLALYEGRYLHEAGDALSAEIRYARCDALLVAFVLFTQLANNHHLCLVVSHRIQLRLSTLAPQAWYLAMEPGSTMPIPSCTALEKLHRLEVERENAPKIRNLREQIGALQ